MTETFSTLGLAAVVISAWLAPYIIARRRQHAQAEWIGALVLLALASAGITWIIALAWALSTSKTDQPGIYRVRGVDAASGYETTLHVTASDAETAKAKADWVAKPGRELA